MTIRTTRTVRLHRPDAAQAQRLFLLMAQVFDEPCSPLPAPFLEGLLSRDDFWAIAAMVGDDIVGGITAYTLPMTRSASHEVFIYDIAVHADHQRRGVGRQLVDALRDEASTLGIDDAFVFADDDDAHALDFYRALGGSPVRATMFSFTRG